jgi:hypothetical protein
MSAVRVTEPTLFEIVSSVRDYGGPGRPMSGDRRMGLEQASAHFKRRTSKILYAVEMWRVAAQRSLLPHPGEIPAEATCLQEVPGWENRKFPTKEQMEECYAVVVSRAPALFPLRDKTVQISRVAAPPARRGMSITDLESYEALGEVPPNPRILYFLGFLNEMLEHDDWTPSEIVLLRDEVVPALTKLFDYLPGEAWDYGDEEEG